VLINLKVYTKA